MNANLAMSAAASPRLLKQLQKAVSGQVLSDVFDRGRYATDASVYQIMPLAVVIPTTMAEVRAVLAAARENGVPVMARGGGTSQCGQTVNRAIVIDYSRHLNGFIDHDGVVKPVEHITTQTVENGTIEVQPGVVLDELNRHLKPFGLWFPVDVSTASRATIGGMAANNSCGSRSIRFGTMRHNVVAMDALLANGSLARFDHKGASISKSGGQDGNAALFRSLLDLGASEAGEIRKQMPDLVRRVGGYNIDALLPDNEGNNLAHLLVGSEGTLGLTESVTLRLSPVLNNRVLGVCHFPTFYDAMDNTRHLVGLDPVAVELVDRNMIGLSRNIDMFKPVIDQCVKGDPDALLLVEFAEQDHNENLRRLGNLSELMAGLGFSFERGDYTRGGVVRVTDPGFQNAIWEVRKQGLNIMMSMKSEGKPVSFVEDCAVQLEDLAEYTRRLTEIFSKYQTSGTWYAHASVGTLHVRPVLNLKLNEDVKKMRAIAEQAFDMVQQYRGSHSGEHGDGIVRSEFHEKMFGSRMVENFQRVKKLLDPDDLLNPGKIVDAPKMDDRALFRFPASYSVPEFKTSLDWSGFSGAGGGFQGAVEMCNNNGACRKLSDGAMCPSYRLTRDEKHLVRGRANSLRLAISGQLGKDALTSDEMVETMKLCVSCKACRRECPTGVDMARMKIEVLAARAEMHGTSLHEKAVAWMPRFAPYLSRLAGLANLRNRIPALARLTESLAGFSARRSLPVWRNDWFRDEEVPRNSDKADVILLVDTFNRYFEPENIRAAIGVLNAAGYSVAVAGADDGGRPLCCGRTFLSAGLVDQARTEAQRTVNVLSGHVNNGAVIVGLEPSCLFTLRDEFTVMLPGHQTRRLAQRAQLFEEFISDELDAGRFSLKLNSANRKAYVHGHCHQKAFNVMGAVEKTLSLIPGLQTSIIDSSCCGMAGAFGFHRDTIDTSLAMAELSLLPAIRKAETDAFIVADGTSCRHQIADAVQRESLHVARVLHDHLENSEA